MLGGRSPEGVDLVLEHRSGEVEVDGPLHSLPRPGVPRPSATTTANP